MDRGSEKDKGATRIGTTALRGSERSQSTHLRGLPAPSAPLRVPFPLSASGPVAPCPYLCCPLKLLCWARVGFVHSTLVRRPHVNRPLFWGDEVRGPLLNQRAAIGVGKLRGWET